MGGKGKCCFDKISKNKNIEKFVISKLELTIKIITDSSKHDDLIFARAIQ